MNDITAIVVLYNPNKELLKKAISSIRDQVGKIILVDNSNDELASQFIRECVGDTEYNYIPNHANLGIASAQNIGIRRGLDDGSKYFFMMDQDSVSKDGTVGALVRSYEKLEKEGMRVGGVCALLICRENNKAYKAIFTRGKRIDDGIYETRQMTNSSSLIAVSTFKDVGFFMDSLFIDAVDHEWCWRAACNGYKFYKNTDVNLEHMLGEGDFNFLFVHIAMSTPFRTYYQYRNYLWLIRLPYVPLGWKVKTGIKHFIKIFIYILLTKKRLPFLKNISRGIKDGIFSYKTDCISPEKNFSTEKNS